MAAITIGISKLRQLIEIAERLDGGLVEIDQYMEGRTSYKIITGDVLGGVQIYEAQNYGFEINSQWVSKHHFNAMPTPEQVVSVKFLEKEARALHNPFKGGE